MSILDRRQLKVLVFIAIEVGIIVWRYAPFLKQAFLAQIQDSDLAKLVEASLGSADKQPAGPRPVPTRPGPYSSGTRSWDDDDDQGAGGWR